jgi:hypothetical protein
MIENGIARFDVAQKIDEGNVVSLGAREGAHDEVEISRGEARPTIRPDHREHIVRNGCVYGKPNQSGLVEAAIYSTPIAAFLLYPREELLPESERLRTLSPDQFAATIVVDQEMPPAQLEFSALSDRARRG